MTVRANINRKFMLRLGLIAVACTGISLWFLYDGTITYPRQFERGEAFRGLETAIEKERREKWDAIAKQNAWSSDYPSTTETGKRAEAFRNLKELEEKDRHERWDAIAKEKGWSTDYPGKKEMERERAEIYVQLVIAAVSAIPGLLYIFFFLRAHGKWIEADETGLTTSWRQRCEFGQIEVLDKKLWKTKGIARIVYDQDGRKRRLTLDDWKYDADPTKEILLEVESRIDVEQIVGGPPEPPPGSPAEDESPTEPEDQAVEADSGE